MGLCRSDGVGVPVVLGDNVGDVRFEEQVFGV